MPDVSVERLPVEVLGLGLIGFDHLHMVLRHGFAAGTPQEDWFVIEGVRDVEGPEVHLGVMGWDGGTTLSDANGGLAGAALEHRIGTSASRGATEIASGADAIALWSRLASYAADIEAQHFPYIAATLAASPLPIINSSSLVASLLHHAGLSVRDALPSGLRFSPGLSTLIGTSGDDGLRSSDAFTTLLGGRGDDRLAGSDRPDTIDKLYGGAGNDTLHWSRGSNVLHGGQPGLGYAGDGIDTADYTGAGDITIEALPPGAPHLAPDFVVLHAGGRDALFSIEEVIWDAARDHVTLGEGVHLVLHAAAAADVPMAIPEVSGSEFWYPLARHDPIAADPKLMPGSFPWFDFGGGG